MSEAAVVIAAASFSALGLVVLVAAWSKFAPSRAQRRSVQSHQRALDVLGEVAKRRDGAAAVHIPSPDEVARAHVQTTDGSPPSLHLASREEISARRPMARLVLRSGPTPLRLPIFGDASAEEVPPPTVHFDDELINAAADESVVIDDVSIESDLRTVRPTELRPEFGAASSFVPEPEEDRDLSLEPVETLATWENGTGGSVIGHIGHALWDRRPSLGNGQNARKVASLAAAVVALAAIGVGTWQVTSNNSPRLPRVIRPSGDTHSKANTPSNSSSHSTNHDITPVSQSGNVVTYPLTAQSFTIRFSASGECWIGVRQSVNGQYLWMTTLLAGGSATYRANGPVYVRIGAPKYAQVVIDGVQLALPPKVQPYDITFATGGAVSA